MLVQRAIENPKPLYFREDFLDAKLTEYLAETGYVIDARQANAVSTEDEFLELVAAALD